MRGALFAAYFFALGWYVRATGLDGDIAQLGADAYRRLIAHTVRTVREAEMDQLRELDIDARRAAGGLAS